MTAGLDPALADLLADPRLSIRRAPPHVSIERYREAADGFMARAPKPAVAATSDHLLQLDERECCLRVVRPFDGEVAPVILFLHGGGFIFGGLESHDGLARSLALSSGAAVATVEYRLAPEHPHPAALDDCLAAFRWLQDNAETLGLSALRMALAGDSAGGQLAAAAASQLGPDQVRHLALLYPMTDPLQQSGSLQELGEGYMLTKDFIAWAWEAHGGNPADPKANVLIADPGSFPTTSVVVAEFDPLRDEGERFVEHLRRGGVAVESYCAQGMIHGFAGLTQVVPDAAARSLAWLGQRLKASLTS